MKRFLSSAAPSSSGRTEPPSNSNSAEQPATSLRSAEQPATPSHLKILCIRDVQRWLAEEPIASCSSAHVQRIREAVAVLSHPKPRKQDVRSLQSKWRVAQNTDKKPRPLEEVLHEFKGKVINAAQKLQLELSDSAEQPAASSVEQSAPMDTADGADPSHLKIFSIRDVQRWLAEEPIGSCSNAGMQRILGRHWFHELLRNSCFVPVL